MSSRRVLQQQMKPRFWSLWSSLSRDFLNSQNRNKPVETSLGELQLEQILRWQELLISRQQEIVRNRAIVWN